MSSSSCNPESLLGHSKLRQQFLSLRSSTSSQTDSSTSVNREPPKPSYENDKLKRGLTHMFSRQRTSSTTLLRSQSSLQRPPRPSLSSFALPPLSPKLHERLSLPFQSPKDQQEIQYGKNGCCLPPSFPSSPPYSPDFSSEYKRPFSPLCHHHSSSSSIPLSNFSTASTVPAMSFPLTVAECHAWIAEQCGHLLYLINDDPNPTLATTVLDSTAILITALNCPPIVKAQYHQTRQQLCEYWERRQQPLRERIQHVV
ncbi:uncharacterized protein BYT42DRAFT_44577 [Radiomyces spectabilis]|uniref:uncharacterized protein n=1 Tax=Radiomyces spectabilis TaxID=64574 RepID=UPI00221F2E77|nr:uncharacterized protein BYT42DRAFT_44577 [Radiomyces spectabilis]KAI8372753.1 hypothetical protein BYT42DRAFT_44577 [Radiomyces spectabilis]